MRWILATAPTASLVLPGRAMSISCAATIERDEPPQSSPCEITVEAVVDAGPGAGEKKLGVPLNDRRTTAANVMQVP